MVQLQDLNQTSADSRYLCFNSFMVQLQGLHSIWHCYTSRVSIPSWYNYKSTSNSRIRNTSKVSIPSWYNYKKNILGLTVALLLSFNSFMVQLQEVGNNSLFPVPFWFQFLHGTITRLEQFQHNLAVKCFNSFMVQLQDQNDILQKEAGLMFQFLHGTITSVGYGIGKVYGIFVSIPSWYNYKKQAFLIDTLPGRFQFLHGTITSQWHVFNSAH